MTTFLLLLALGYLVGAIPFALIIARQVAGIDIRKHGSGNVGATNVTRVVGKRAGAVCFVLDFLKGFAPTLVAVYLVTEPALGMSVALQCLLVGIAAVIGHCFPIYLMTLGGKGIATSIGVFCVLLPWPTAIIAVYGVLFIATTGYVAIASVTGSILLPILAVAFRQPIEYIAVTVILAVVLTLRHMGNIRRFFAGTEPKIWDKARYKEFDAEAIPGETDPPQS